jgi:hypothetical protein
MSIDQFLLSSDSTEINLPKIRPSLDLNFAKTKSLDPRISFTRSSGGSYVGQDGFIKYAGINEPRFDHDPITGECLGLLVEETKTNSLTNSVTFTSTWSPSDATITQFPGSGPLVENNVIKIIPNTNGTNQHSYNGGTYTPTFTAQDTFSFFAKADGYRYVWVRLDGVFFGNGGGAIFDLQTGTVSSQLRGIANIKKYRDGWYRCSFSAVLTNLLSIRIGVAINTLLNESAYPQTAFVGDNVDGILLSAPQFESGGFPTSYIPTFGTARTRLADFALITGSNFTEFYKQDQGTIFVSTIKNYVGGNNFYGILSVDNNMNMNNDSLNYIVSDIDDDRLVFSILTNNLTEASQLISPITTPWVHYKLISSYRRNNVVSITENKLPIVDNIANIPNNLNRMIIGGLRGNLAAQKLGGTISRIIYYPRSLTREELLALV